MPTPALLLAVLGALLAAQFVALAATNLLFYRRLRVPAPVAASRSPAPEVSILIPARDEAANIRGAVTAALANRGIPLEVVVLDDQSSDATAAIVAALAARDARVRLIAGGPLPPGWCGKQHACQQLAAAARGRELLFVDADVRLEPDAAASLVAARRRRRCALLSGVPRQVTGSLLERLVIPLIHVVLLGYLPFAGVRFTRRPAFAAACGQLMLVDAEAYREAGGHQSIAGSWHDGLALPKAFRSAGFATDLVDVANMVSCRMYRGAAETWAGFTKNAGQGLGSDRGIWLWTLLLVGGHVLPPLMVLGALLTPEFGMAGRVAAAATSAVLALRLVFVWRFGHPLSGALLFPVGVLVLLAIQWHAWWQRRSGVRPVWKGRVQHDG